MSKGKAVSLFVVLLFLTALSAAQDEDFSKVQMKVTKVAGSVYMLEGPGGNIGASVGDDGIVIVELPDNVADSWAEVYEKISDA